MKSDSSKKPPVSPFVLDPSYSQISSISKLSEEPICVDRCVRGYLDGLVEGLKKHSEPLLSEDVHHLDWLF